MAGLVSSSVAPAVAADPVDGARTSGDAMFPNVGNGGYDALNYDIDLAWTPDAVQTGSVVAGSIVATSTMTARASAPLRSFSLDFEGLVVDSVTVDGTPAAWQRDIDAGAIRHKLVVTPATPVTGEFRVTIAYHGVPQAHVDADGSYEGWNATTDGATMLGQPVGNMTGFPHNNTPGDKATYSISLDVPTTLTDATGAGAAPAAAVSNGELLSKTPSADGTRTTWAWQQTKQMASELLLISIGRYDVIESSVTLTDGSTIPAWSFVDSTSTTANKATVTTAVSQLGPIIRNLESLYGPYPGRSAGVVVDRVPRGINYALETQDRSFFPTRINTSTLVHELAHQWYGNNVSPTTWTDIWVAEGMATWSESYYAGSDGFGAGTASREAQFDAWNSTPAEEADWTIAPGAQTDSASLYDYQTYDRSAQFWAALRVAIGDDAFFDVVKQWQLRNSGTSTTGADLLALAEEISGRDLEAFYTDWILDADKPAWPDQFTLALTTAATAPLDREASTSYTLTADNTGLVPLASSTATLDVSGILDRASINEATLPVGVTLSGDELVWTIPATDPGRTATTTFEVTIADDASGGVLTAEAVTSLGGTCAVCASTLAVREYPVDAQAPVIVGETAVGSMLTATTPGWTEGTSFAYSWAVDGTPIPDATTPTYVIPPTAEGRTVTVTVTGNLTDYLTQSRTSAPVGPVVAAVVPSPSASPSVSAAAVPPAGPGQLGATGSEAPIAAMMWALAAVIGGAALSVMAVRRRRVTRASDAI
ncbi:M1 family metallopeptidase [Microbacterium testaceum]|uniref:M1 family metallopeptidase n=1 Tax=Microbacterium testaceum TaxID=2033 RepID=UPI0012481D29|nr:M1 family metallopeptidase [Microbacterium testaceum]